MRSMRGQILVAQAARALRQWWCLRVDKHHWLARVVVGPVSLRLQVELAPQHPVLLLQLDHLCIHSLHELFVVGDLLLVKLRFVLLLVEL